MKIENTIKESEILTEEQTAQVAGGALTVSALRLTGCPTCTSGGLLSFKNIAAIVNPAPEILAV